MSEEADPGKNKKRSINKLSCLLEYYQKKNEELAEREEQIKSRLSVLESTLPAITLWNMWKNIMSFHGMEIDSSGMPILSADLGSHCESELKKKLQGFQERLASENTLLEESRRTEAELQEKIRKLEAAVEARNEILPISEESNSFEKLSKLVAERLKRRNKLEKLETQESIFSDSVQQTDSLLNRGSRRLGDSRNFGNLTAKKGNTDLRESIVMEDSAEEQSISDQSKLKQQFSEKQCNKFFTQMKANKVRNSKTLEHHKQPSKLDVNSSSATFTSKTVRGRRVATVDQMSKPSCSKASNSVKSGLFNQRETLKDLLKHLGKGSKCTHQDLPSSNQGRSPIENDISLSPSFIKFCEWYDSQRIHQRQGSLETSSSQTSLYTRSAQMLQAMISDIDKRNSL